MFKYPKELDTIHYYPHVIQNSNYIFLYFVEK